MDPLKKIERLIGQPLPFTKSEEDGSPVYFQLARSIRRQIENGKLKSGELIPSERKVAASTTLSIATVRKAFEELVKIGLLIRFHGKGTYVAGTADRRKRIRYYPFVDDFTDELLPTDIARSLGLSVVPAQADLNRRLKIRKDQALIELKRVIAYAGEPMVFGVSYFPRDMFKGLENCPLTELASEPIYLYIEKKFGVTTYEHIEMFSAVLADEETASALAVKPGQPLLRIDKLVFTLNKKPYECRISYCKTDQFKIRRII